MAILYDVIPVSYLPPFPSFSLLPLSSPPIPLSSPSPLPSPASAPSQPASSCDESAYPVVNYIISIPGLEGSVTETHTGDSIAVNLTSADINGLGEGSYTVNVMACAAFTCRSADPVHVG